MLNKDIFLLESTFTIPFRMLLWTHVWLSTHAYKMKFTLLLYKLLATKVLFKSVSLGTDSKGHTYCILITYVMNQPTVYSQTTTSNEGCLVFITVIPNNDFTYFMLLCISSVSEFYF